jgi:hypothetical protein
MVTTAVGWTVLESNPGGSERLSTPIQTCPKAHPVSYTMGTLVSFPGIKSPGHGINHPPQSTVKVKERVELHTYSPSTQCTEVVCSIPVVFKRCSTESFLQAHSIYTGISKHYFVDFKFHFYFSCHLCA